jgi:hypothetical protein
VQLQQMLCDSRVAITNTGQWNHPPNCCSYHGQIKGTVYKCGRCDVGLWVVFCFIEYHTRVNL